MEIAMGAIAGVAALLALILTVAFTAGKHDPKRLIRFLLLSGVVLFGSVGYCTFGTLPANDYAYKIGLGPIILVTLVGSVILAVTCIFALWRLR